MRRFAYLFKEGSAAMTQALGMKGRRLVEMQRLGLPVAPGLIIPAEVMAEYSMCGKILSSGAQKEICEKLSDVESGLGQKFGSADNPLFLAVRASPEEQIPGLNMGLYNIGLSDISVMGLAKQMKNDLLALNSYRQFVEEFSEKAMKIHPSRLLLARDKFLKSKKANNIRELSAVDMRELVTYLQIVVERNSGKKFPQNPEEQLWMAIEAVYGSWTGNSAQTYRRLHDLTHVDSTALLVQKMINNANCSGVVYSRNPIDGEKELYGEYLMKENLDSLLYGKVTPSPIEELKFSMPKSFAQLEEYSQVLEKRFQCVQDIRFSIEGETLSINSSEDGCLSASAEVKVAVDLVKEGILSRDSSIQRIPVSRLLYLHHQILESKAAASQQLLGKGIPGSNASASGHVAFDMDKVNEFKKQGKKVVLITKKARENDFLGLSMLDGYVTQYGGATTNTSLLCRATSIAAVLSCGELQIEGKECTIGGKKIKEGDIVTVNGLDGEIYEGEVPLVDAEVTPEYDELMRWVDAAKKMKVLVNAFSLDCINVGKKYGAEGLGLCKTEQMFGESEKRELIQRAILIDNDGDRRRELEKLVQLHKEDFKNIFKAMSGRPAIIRILDPPLASFFPRDPEELKKLSESLGIPVSTKHEQLAQYNPILGLRGSRLASVYPEFVQFEVKSIFIAALEAIEEGATPLPYIELPMISSEKEFLLLSNMIKEIADETGALDKINYKLGLLVEIPRVALIADEVARHSDFLYFGTDNLTQLAYGFSQEDSMKIINKYVSDGVFKKNPFKSIDINGVGELMKICIQRSRKAKKKLKIGCSGEHSSDLASIKFFHQIGVHELSCAPHHIAATKVAAAQAALLSKK